MIRVKNHQAVATALDDTALGRKSQPKIVESSVDYSFNIDIVYLAAPN